MTELVHSSLYDLALLVEISQTTEDSLLSASYLNKAIQQKNLFSIVVDHVVVGFIVHKVVADEAELLQITISPAFQKRGIGLQAMSAWHAKLRFDGVKDVFLEVRATNAAANSLYKKLNYEVIGRRKNYYRINGQSGDALMMKATL